MWAMPALPLQSEKNMDTPNNARGWAILGQLLRNPDIQSGEFDELKRHINLDLTRNGRAQLTAEGSAALAQTISQGGPAYAHSLLCSWGIR